MQFNNDAAGVSHVCVRTGAYAADLTNSSWSIRHEWDPENVRGILDSYYIVFFITSSSWLIPVLTKTYVLAIENVHVKQ